MLPMPTSNFSRNTVFLEGGQTVAPMSSPRTERGTGGRAFGESLAASTGRLGRGTFLKPRDDMWRFGKVRSSASPPGALGESAAGQRAASGAARSRAAGRQRERGAPGLFGAERWASSRRQHGAVTPHRPAAPAAGTAGGDEAGCALADG